MGDKEILKITNSFTKGMLGKDKPTGKCFMVASALQGYLSICDLETHLIEGEIKSGKDIYNHFWLLLADGRILDPTASQFKTPEGEDMPKTYLGEKPEWYKTPKKKKK